MKAILGIDAAWTAHEPSGVALVALHDGAWRCTAVAPSYESFLMLAYGQPVDWPRKPKPTLASAQSLLHAASVLVDGPVSIVAIDMPVSRAAISGRRAADDHVSRQFGSRGCSTHSPGPVRPGPIGAGLTQQFAQAGFQVATTATPPGTDKRLIEVYPHPALLTLLGRQYRVPYKASKSLSYWPGSTIAQRVDLLLAEFAQIAAALQRAFTDMQIQLPAAASVTTLSGLKQFEDALDALVCCWVGTLYASSMATPLGDETCAIWCP